MRTYVTLTVTTEERLSDLPAAVEGMEERENIHQTNEEERDPALRSVPPATEVPETSPKVINVRFDQVSSSRRNVITRETSLLQYCE